MRWHEQMFLITTVRPTAEPITLAEARAHCRVDVAGSPATSPDDATLQAAIAAARDFVEQYTGRSLMTQSRRALFATLPPSCVPLQVPRGPVIDVQSLTIDGEPFTDFTLLRDDRVAFLVPTTAWPCVPFKAGRVALDYRAGYVAGSPEAPAVPAAVRQALLLLVEHFHRNRGAVDVPMAALELGVESLLSGFADWSL
jgi:uncharacterized phiE125 gp8 family phage protein